MIREVIVVEGKDDIARVKSALDCEVIATGGFAFGEKLLRQLRKIEKRRGVIILTDPDYMGEQIRRRLTRALKAPKQAYLPQDKAIKADDIGIENARPEDIRIAVERAQPMREDYVETFTKADMIRWGLVGSDAATERRRKLGESLGIGHGNGKQFLNRLNRFGITIEEFTEKYEEVLGGKETL
ncbi:ribonuclease M5 [Aedoeadaptatus ivorii]|uniref:Ribonuclease M5 n=1 Tax=Aedoeadaptatus ivorii TaxID=54006 RepID=A0A3S5BWD3_9FIRM|nr:ribonuclease M5 [Peptoniphilus ivorii]MDQ0508158.1 ribonuclease M5 [Peptoniphilus ivorii]VEJ35888.1 ribonuclease M5 [Peptoniphilus ivorii]